MGKASRGQGRGQPPRAHRGTARGGTPAQQRQRLYIAGGGIVAVIVIVLGFVVWKTTSSNSGNTAGGTSNGPTGTALATVIGEVTGVPTSALDAVGGGSVALAGASRPVSGTALTASGKPEVFFDGAEYCPFCAANRWAMVVSLSKFGTFSGLKTIHSSAQTPRPMSRRGRSTARRTPASTSPSPRSRDHQRGRPGHELFGTLQTPTTAEQTLLTKYDPPEAGSTGSPIPFVDFGGKYAQGGDLPMLQPTNLTGDWEKIASDLKDPSTANAKAVDAAANFMTAAICKLTNNQPATACTSTVQSLESQL